MVQINKNKSLFLLATLALWVHVHAQSSEKWVTMEGTAYGNCISEVKQKALQDARSKALASVGINVAVSNLALQQEVSGRGMLNDFFTQMVEESTTGLITEEKIIKQETTLEKDQVRSSVQIKAFVKKQQGEKDPYFNVRMESDRKNIRSGEAVKLNIKSSQDGYLTLLAIQKDKVVQLFPNSIQQDNWIAAGKTNVFPSMRVYNYKIFNTENTLYVEDVIAIVSKKRIPLATNAINSVQRNGMLLQIPTYTLVELANWLFLIPAKDRASTKTSILVDAEATN